jgi:hypothetical protein
MPAYVGSNRLRPIGSAAERRSNMKRIIAVIGLALVISALTAASAVARVQVGHLITAPHPNGNSNAPSAQIRSCIPFNDGTDTAADDTDAPPINAFCGS